MRWPWQRNGHDAKRVREQAARERVTAQKMTPLVERLAEAMADLPAEELNERMRRAMTVRHP